MKNIVFLMVVWTFTFGCSCSRTVSVEIPPGNQLPADMSFPGLSGSIDKVADEFCDWVNRSQIEYERGVPPAVYIDTVTGLDGGRNEPANLVVAFLQQDLPRQLVIRLDPAASEFSSEESFTRLRARLDSVALWSFEKMDSVSCEETEASVLQFSNYGKHWCLRITRLSSVPSFPRADFRNLYLKINDTEFGDQDVNLQVMTVSDGNKIIGRTVSANFYASHTQVGGLNRNCRPILSAGSFESAGASQ